MSTSIDDKTDPRYTIVLEDMGFWTFEEPGQLLGALRSTLTNMLWAETCELPLIIT